MKKTKLEIARPEEEQAQGPEELRVFEVSHLLESAVHKGGDGQVRTIRPAFAALRAILTRERRVTTHASVHTREKLKG